MFVSYNKHLTVLTFLKDNTTGKSWWVGDSKFKNVKIISRLKKKNRIYQILQWPILKLQLKILFCLLSVQYKISRQRFHSSPEIISQDILSYRTQYWATYLLFFKFLKNTSFFFFSWLHCIRLKFRDPVFFPHEPYGHETNLAAEQTLTINANERPQQIQLTR